MTSFDKRFKKTEHIIVFPQQEFRVPLHQVHGYTISCKLMYKFVLVHQFL